MRLAPVHRHAGVKGSVSQSLREVSDRKLRMTAMIRNQDFIAAVARRDP